MKISKILEEKIGFYVNLKYTEIFCSILRNIKDILKNEEKNKPYETIFNKYYIEKNFNKQKSIKETIDNYYKILKKSMFTKEKCLNFTLSKLELSYLKRKAKIIRNKCNIIAKQYNKLESFIIEKYIKLCMKKINKIKEEELEKIELENQKNKKFKFKKQKTIKEKEIESEEEELGEHEKMINLFIGKLDYKKYSGKIKIITIERENFVSGFLFRNIDEKNHKEDESNQKLLTFISPTEHYKDKLIRTERKKKRQIIRKNFFNINSRNNFIHSINKDYSNSNTKTLPTENSLSIEKYESKNKIQFCKSYKFNKKEKNNSLNQNLNKEKINNSINLPSIEKKKKSKRILKNNPLKLNYFSKIDMYY